MVQPSHNIAEGQSSVRKLVHLEASPFGFGGYLDLPHLWATSAALHLERLHAVPRFRHIEDGASQLLTAAQIHRGELERIYSFFIARMVCRMRLMSLPSPLACMSTSSTTLSHKLSFCALLSRASFWAFSCSRFAFLVESIVCCR